MKGGDGPDDSGNAMLMGTARAPAPHRLNMGKQLCIPIRRDVKTSVNVRSRTGYARGRQDSVIINAGGCLTASLSTSVACVVEGSASRQKYKRHDMKQKVNTSGAEGASTLSPQHDCAQHDCCSRTISVHFRHVAGHVTHTVLLPRLFPL